MSQLERDASALRCEAIERRVEYVERAAAVNRLLVFVFAGLVVAAVLVCAVEIRHVYQLVESQAWRSR